MVLQLIGNFETGIGLHSLDDAIDYVEYNASFLIDKTEDDINCLIDATNILIGINKMFNNALTPSKCKAILEIILCTALFNRSVLIHEFNISEATHALNDLRDYEDQIKEELNISDLYYTVGIDGLEFIAKSLNHIYSGTKGMVFFAGWESALSNKFILVDIVHGEYLRE